MVLDVAVVGLSLPLHSSLPHSTFHALFLYIARGEGDILLALDTCGDMYQESINLVVMGSVLVFSIIDWYRVIQELQIKINYKHSRTFVWFLIFS